MALHTASTGRLNRPGFPEGGVAVQGVTAVGIGMTGGEQQAMKADHLRQQRNTGVGEEAAARASALVNYPVWDWTIARRYLRSPHHVGRQIVDREPTIERHALSSAGSHGNMEKSEVGRNALERI
ncbi:hypothetical protein [Azospirillum ramasamyi]|uniref:hypothetical protein n=1 Tax=Azospirillum ramasamyi TaxID=682998 RepID=UPI0013A6AE4E|nr:hypothetical protein [Azospirillum ramasamyi]